MHGPEEAATDEDAGATPGIPALRQIDGLHPPLQQAAYEDLLGECRSDPDGKNHAGHIKVAGPYHGLQI